MKKLLFLSLAAMSFSSFASPSCDQYFKSMEGYLEQIKSSPETSAQYDAVKGQYDQAKKQLASLPEAQQEEACKQGLNVLKMAEEQIKKMKP
ncbi:DUF5339 domain-containing protein [Enterobacteriaceae bacterium ESL0689]|nr:DUF5339 domain-containing protein [Enterobacteriaceae bacterium ESL0689]